MFYVAGGVERTLGIPVIPGTSSYVGAPSKVQGEGVSITATNGNASLPGLFPVESITTAHTFASLTHTPNTISFETLLSIPYNASWSSPYAFLFRKTGGNYEIGIPTSGPAYSATTTGTTFTARMAMHMATRDGINIQTWVDGRLNGTSAAGPAGSAVWPATRRDIIIGNTFPGNTEASSSVHVVGALWNRALSATEVEWFSREPYAMLVAPRRFTLDRSTARLRRGWGVELAA